MRSMQSFNFWSSEERQRGRYFNQMVADTDRLLHEPDVMARLGSFAGVLAEINHSAFLPNVRFGRAYTPRKYRNDPFAVALLPVSDEEAAKRAKIVSPIANEESVSYALPAQIYSPGVGHMIGTRALLASFSSASRHRDVAPDHGQNDTTTHPTTKAENSLAWVGLTSVCAAYDQGALTYSPSRPVETIKTSLLEQDNRRFAASVVLHEHVHSYDIAAMGPVFLTPSGRAASELHAYHNQFLTRSYPELAPDAKEVQVERLRQQHADPELPFTPTPLMYEGMQELAVL